MKTLRIIIAPTGMITIDAVGYHGTDCERATHALEQLLGTATDHKHKPEYYQASTGTIDAQTRLSH